MLEVPRSPSKVKGNVLLAAESVTASDCLTVVGWFERAIETSGGKNVCVTETRCRAEGDARCEYECDWS